jgi:hypothetical protein
VETRNEENNNKMNLKYIGYEGINWIHMAQDMGSAVNSRNYGNEFRVS